MTDPRTHGFKFATQEEADEWFKTIDPLDAYGFHVRQDHYWLPETPHQELTRLEFNLGAYREFLLCGSRFPPEIKAAREKDFHRARTLRERM